MNPSVNRGPAGPSNPESTGGPDMDTIHRLVTEAVSGDAEAFGELVKTYHQRVYSLAYGLLDNAEDAKEAAQQTWVKAWSKLGSYQRSSEFFTWIYRIASNTCLDHLRLRGRRREDALPEGRDPVPDLRVERAPSQHVRPDQDAERKEIRQLFEQGLQSLTPEHRLALTLREVDGLSYEEIAKITGCRKGTVMSRIFYARRRMQEIMGELR